MRARGVDLRQLRRAPAQECGIGQGTGPQRKVDVLDLPLARRDGERQGCGRSIGRGAGQHRHWARVAIERDEKPARPIDRHRCTVELDRKAGRHLSARPAALRQPSGNDGDRGGDDRRNGCGTLVCIRQQRAETRSKPGQRLSPIGDHVAASRCFVAISALA